MFKAIDINDTFEYISINDPAVVQSESNTQLYVKTLDKKHLVFNGEPTIFVLGVIPDREYTAIQDKFMQVSAGADEMVNVSPFGMAREFVRVGLKGVRNAEGFTLKFEGGRHPKKVAESSMTQLRAWGVIDEIGNILMQYNNISDNDKKKSGL